MKLAARLDKLEVEHNAAPAHLPAKPSTLALEIVLEGFEHRHLLLPEHPDMPQVIARDLLARGDVSQEVRETAQRYLAGECEH